MASMPDKLVHTLRNLFNIVLVVWRWYAICSRCEHLVLMLTSARYLTPGIWRSVSNAQHQRSLPASECELDKLCSE